MQNKSAEWIWRDADSEPSDEQLEKLMSLVRDDVVSRAKQAEARFAATREAIALKAAQDRMAAG